MLPIGPTLPIVSSNPKGNEIVESVATGNIRNFSGNSKHKTERTKISGRSWKDWLKS